MPLLIGRSVPVHSTVLSGKLEENHWSTVIFLNHPPRNNYQSRGIHERKSEICVMLVGMVMELVDHARSSNLHPSSPRPGSGRM
jgi:hypothetical protein